MDRKTKQAVDEFTLKMHMAHPEIPVEVKEYKWSDEDATLEILLPKTITEDEENDILDMRTMLTGNLFDSTGVYILAVARTVEQPTV